MRAGLSNGIRRLPLATIKDVRELPPGEARRGPPGQTPGRRDYWMKPRNFVFIQDSTGGHLHGQHRRTRGAGPARGRGR